MIRPYDIPDLPTDAPVTMNESATRLVAGNYELDLVEANGPLGPRWRVREFAKRHMPASEPKGRSVADMPKSVQRAHGHQHGSNPFNPGGLLG